MPSPTASPTLEFQYGFDEVQACEAEDRGYQSHVWVHVGDKRYQVTFYDPGRLRQDLEEMAGRGEPYLADPGMIVVPVVTREAMETAVHGLHRAHFFESLIPVPARSE